MSTPSASAADRPTASAIVAAYARLNLRPDTGPAKVVGKAPSHAR